MEGGSRVGEGGGVGGVEVKGVRMGRDREGEGSEGETERETRTRARARAHTHTHTYTHTGGDLRGPTLK